MRYKMFALILALTVVTWAQTSTQTTASTPQQSTVPADKAKCACCDKMAAADSKDAKACCTHHDMKNMGDMKDSEEMASCCAKKDSKSSDGKEAMSCMKDSKDKAAASCCKGACSKHGCAKDKTAASCCGGTCGKDGQKGCCSGMKSEKTAENSCSKEMHS